MQRSTGSIEQAAATHATVLIHGETGTGKELVAARASTSSRPRASGPFVAVNCAACPRRSSRASSSATSAAPSPAPRPTAPGCFELADGGTLFLDEIGEMPLGAAGQAPARAPGAARSSASAATETLEVDVRVIAATNRDLGRGGRATARFREDLYYRLNVFALAVPPLRERREDIPLLADALLAAVSAERHDAPSPASTHAAARDRSVRYAWPGNVRELRGTSSSARFIACESDVITAEILPGTSPVARSASWSGDSDILTAPIGLPLREVEKQFVLRTLAAESNNKTRAADRLGISTKTLHNMLQRWGLLHRQIPRGST